MPSMGLGLGLARSAVLGGLDFADFSEVVSEPQAVYSTARKLYPDYTGASCQIERISDAELYDVPFAANGLVDVAAAKTFLGLTTADDYTDKRWLLQCLARLRILYDQSGNGNDIAFNDTNARYDPFGPNGLPVFVGQIPISLPIPTGYNSADFGYYLMARHQGPSPGASLVSLINWSATAYRVYNSNGRDIQQQQANFTILHASISNASLIPFIYSNKQTGGDGVNALVDRQSYSNATGRVAVATTSLQAFSETGASYDLQELVLAKYFNSADRSAVNVAADSLKVSADPVDTFIYVHGDSNTFGYLSSSTVNTHQRYSWPWLVGNDQDLSVLICNLSVSAHVWSSISTVTSDAGYANSRATLKIFAAPMGQNNIDLGQTAANVHTEAAAVLSGRKTLGYTVIAFTIPTPPVFTAGEITELDAYNQLLRDNPSNYNYLIDLAVEDFSTYWQADDTHWTIAAHQFIAVKFAEVLGLIGV